MNHIWNERLDKIKTKFEIESEQGLAKTLGISKQALLQIRQDKTQPSVTTKLMIMDKLGFDKLREVLLEVLPEEKKKLVKTKWNRMTNKINKAD
ncbi:hypothetical protein AB6C40_23885 [Vibrio splendidus]